MNIGYTYDKNIAKMCCNIIIAYATRIQQTLWPAIETHPQTCWKLWMLGIFKVLNLMMWTLFKM